MMGLLFFFRVRIRIVSECIESIVGSDKYRLTHPFFSSTFYAIFILSMFVDADFRAMFFESMTRHSFWESERGNEFLRCLMSF